MQRRRALEDEPRVHAMTAAAARCGDEFRNVRYALYERIEEEKEHETWVLEDVGAVGGDVAGAKADPPSAPVQAMIAFNYHGAERVHPCSVLGMLYMLEVVSSVYGGGYRTRSRALGRDVNGGGFKFLTSHATMDVDHMASLNQLLKTIADPTAQRSIINCTRMNFYLFAQMFRENGFVTHIAG